MTTLSKIQKWGLLLFVFLLPWQTHYLVKSVTLAGGVSEYLSIKLFGIDLLLGALALLAVFHGETVIQEMRARALPLLGLLVFAFFSIVWADDALAAMMGFVRLTEGTLLVFTVLRTRVSVTELLSALVLAGAVQGAFALVQFIAQSSFESAWLGLALHDPSVPGTAVIETLTGRWLRAYGAFTHPNVLGGFLALAFVAAAGLCIQERRRVARVLFGIALVFITSGLLVSFSRASWLAAAIGFAVLAGWIVSRRSSPLFQTQTESRVHRYQFMTTSLIIIIILALFTTAFGDLLSPRLSMSGRIETRSIIERSDFTRDAFDLIRTRWATGVGVANITPAMYAKVDSTRKVYAYQPPHNLFILVFTELGIAGLLMMIFLFINLFLERAPKQGSALPLASLLVLVLLVLSFFDHYFWTIPQAILLF
ncbi:MAG: O-antigen ligase family protein, partial [Candidatus Kerfeldbacteria bacterium]|nr:O-antigen ligase family protein [Candidatus Kerfeldbacteria bacterium]